jgi:hypothetical protein
VRTDVGMLFLKDPDMKRGTSMAADTSVLEHVGVLDCYRSFTASARD